MEPGLDDLRTIKRHCGLTKKREAPLGGLSCSKIVSTPRRDLMFLARLPLPQTFLFHTLSALFSPPPSLPRHLWCALTALQLRRGLQPDARRMGDLYARGAGAAAAAAAAVVAAVAAQRKQPPWQAGLWSLAGVVVSPGSRGASWNPLTPVFAGRITPRDNA
ncbi:hypothetical protein CCHR01_15923 [Colletotrichum chrysophilum]|uniref:Uncharacterized protein n=1 Tax=Colletotrichum chrysophilum TaxID=1836956 RepID=A0AAD9A5B8_9PEZI|nr:hypothetical protein CCHR01_15923 [Colletotrichum chrysophilum]